MKSDIVVLSAMQHDEYNIIISETFVVSANNATKNIVAIFWIIYSLMNAIT